jgi:hypothetical protein
MTKSMKRPLRAIGVISVTAVHAVLSVAPVVMSLALYGFGVCAYHILGHRPIVMINDPKLIEPTGWLYDRLFVVSFYSWMLSFLGGPLWLGLTLGRFLNLTPVSRAFHLLAFCGGWLYTLNEPHRLLGWMLD